MNKPQAPEKIVERVRKLMAMAKDDAAGAEHERDNALRMAYKLMTKHNLSEKDFVSRDRAEVAFMIDVCPWRRQVCNSIAKLFFCKFFSSPVKAQSLRAVFIGDDDNATTAMEMARYTIKSISKEGGIRRREKFGNAKGEASRYETSFFNGAANALYYRCEALRKEAEDLEKVDVQAAGVGTALILANHYEQEMAKNVQFIVDTLGITLTKSKPRAYVNLNFEAFSKGIDFGKQMSLSKQIK